MTALVITIPGEMRGKQRPRVTRQGHAYTPEQTTNAEAWVRACAIDAGVRAPMEGALRLRMEVRKAIPPSWSRKEKAAALAGTRRPTGKPDVDNLAKLVGDALNGIVWRDDAQIVDLHVSKIYADAASTTLTVEAA